MNHGGRRALDELQARTDAATMANMVVRLHDKGVCGDCGGADHRCGDLFVARMVLDRYAPGDEFSEIDTTEDEFDAMRSQGGPRV